MKNESAFPKRQKIEQKSNKERREKCFKHTTLVIPQNDGESIMIGLIADELEIDVRRIDGDWDASHEDIARQLASLDGFKRHIVAVELPNPDIEKEWEEALDKGGTFTWIDHHDYPNGLKRKRGESDKCSLDQFFVFFGLDDEFLYKGLEKKGFKYDKRFVKGVAINDRWFISGLINAGYSLEEIKGIREFDRKGQYGDHFDEIQVKNKEKYDKRKSEGMLNILDFGNERIAYTYAKDLVVFNSLEEVDGKVYQNPVCIFTLRPSIKRGGLFDIAIDLEGVDSEDEKRQLFFAGINDEHLDRRARDKESYSTTWYKADVTEEKLEEIKLFVKTFVEQNW